jgi:hypothetical protein
MKPSNPHWINLSFLQVVPQPSFFMKHFHQSCVHKEVIKDGVVLFPKVPFTQLQRTFLPLRGNFLTFVPSAYKIQDFNKKPFLTIVIPKTVHSNFVAFSCKIYNMTALEHSWR